MAEETPKGKRAKNFVENEKQLLVELIQNEFSVILVSNKSTFTKHKKELAWDSLTKRYNSEDVTARNKGELKKAWLNMVSRSKKKYDDSKKWRKATGGGPPAPPSSQVTNRIASMLAQTFAAIDVLEDDDDEDGDGTGSGKC